MPRKKKGSKKGKERPSGRLGSRFGHVYADLPARGRSMTGGAAASSPSGAGAGAAPTYTPEDLAKKGEEMVLRLQPELAVEFFRRALSMKPDSPAILDALGAVQLEQLGDVDGATASFKESIRLAPDASASKWMYMGQLQEAPDALASFQKGISVLNAERAALLAQPDAPGKAEAIKRVEAEVSSAFCTMAELYVTDLCDLPDAESKCQEMLDLALTADATNLEALQQLANFRVCQQRPGDARDAMSQVVSALAALDEEDLPPAPFRAMSAKLLIEIEMARDAVPVLEQLLCENDTDLEVWFLIATAYRNISKPATGVEYLNMAVQAFEKHKLTHPEDKDSNDAIDQLKLWISDLEADGPDVEGDDEDEGEGDEDLADSSGAGAGSGV